ncbi:MAG: Asp23/Gls24 family envelope stress response protein [Candidatus Omnitrophica bacterium]|nr:Asp23/Gls24 family envelope stress response protein [Candidatus Omnitrophota bacterium]
MLEDSTVDLGDVQMHKKVIGDIAAATLKEIPGVHLARFGILSSIFGIFGYKNYPGVSVRLDKEGAVSLHMRVVVEYGLNIPSIASRVQDTVRAAVERAADIDLREININIQSVERGDASCG